MIDATNIRIRGLYNADGISSVVLYGYRGGVGSGMITVRRDMGGWLVRGRYSARGGVWYADFADAIKAARHHVRRSLWYRETVNAETETNNAYLAAMAGDADSKGE